MLDINKLQKGFNIKNWMFTVIFFLILTDLSIILDIPFLREVFSFIFFSVVPGFLVILILNLKGMNPVKKVVLSVGMSISFLMIIGLALNSLYPLLNQPLSFTPVFVTLNLFVVLLSVAAYWRNRNVLEDDFGFKLDLKDKLRSPLIFPFSFPLLAILGTYLMNTTQNNVLLLIMLLLIPLYLVAVVYLQGQDPFCDLSPGTVAHWPKPAPDARINLQPPPGNRCSPGILQLPAHPVKLLLGPEYLLQRLQCLYEYNHSPPDLPCPLGDGWRIHFQIIHGHHRFHIAINRLPGRKKIYRG